MAEGLTDLTRYRLADLILGKEKQVTLGNDTSRYDFKTFDPMLRKAIAHYCHNGGNLFASGAYVATDLWDNGTPDPEAQQFANRVLHYTWRTGQASTSGRVQPTPSPFARFNHLALNYWNTLNATCYAAESPDGIEPCGAGSYTIQRYDDTRIGAGVFYRGYTYSTCVLGYPFETIVSDTERDALMQAILSTFDEAAGSDTPSNNTH